MDIHSAKEAVNYTIKQFHELRITVQQGHATKTGSTTQTIAVHLKTGSCECFGSNLVPGIPYNLIARGGYSFFSWSGCEIEVVGAPGLIYITNDTTYPLLANINYELEKDRKQSDNNNVNGPVTMILGRAGTGKTSITRTLSHYALRTGWYPTVIDLNTEVNAFSIPGTITAAPIEFQSKPTHLERYAKTNPIVFFYGHDSLETNSDLYLQQCSALSKIVTSRLLTDKSRPVDFPGYLTYREHTQGAHDGMATPDVSKGLVDIPKEVQGKTKHAGIFIDTPSELTSMTNRLEIITKLAEIFHVNIILCVDNEHLHQELTQYQPLSTSTNPPAVAKITRSLGVIHRSVDDRVWAAKQTINKYFHGGKGQLRTVPLSIHPMHAMFYSTSPVDFVPLTALPLGTAAQYQQTHGQHLEQLPGDQLKLNTIIALSYSNSESLVSTTPILGFMHIKGVPAPDDMHAPLQIVAPSGISPHIFKTFLVGSITWSGIDMMKRPKDKK